MDTADVYSQGESEQVVGRALRGRRDDVFLATKFHGQMSPNPAHSGNSRRWIMQAVEGSLRRLQTDRIDLYQAHRPDYNTDVLETITALNDLIRQGKILYYGTSVFTPAQLVEAQWLATTNHLIPPVANQVPYSMLVRGNERDVLPIAQQYGLGVLAYGPLAGGWLSGDFVLDAGKPPTRVHSLPGRYDISGPSSERKLPGGGLAGQAGGQAGDLARGAFRRLRAEPPGSQQRDHRPAHRGPPSGLPEGGGHPARANRCWTPSMSWCRPGPTSWSATPGPSSRPWSTRNSAAADRRNRRNAVVRCSTYPPLTGQPLTLSNQLR